MAALPIIADVFRVAMNWTEPGGQTATNVMHFRDVAGGNTASDLMTALDAHVTANMWLAVFTGAVVTDVAITPLDGTSATDHFQPATPSHWTGQNGADFVPAGSAILKLATTKRGRSHRGRVFLPFLPESSQTKGVLDSTQEAATTTNWTTFLHALEGATPAWDWVVASYKLATADAVVVVSCEPMIATQRRRQGRLRTA
jgi:hypothetical protein